MITVIFCSADSELRITVYHAVKSSALNITQRVKNSVVKCRDSFFN